ncbi:MAG: ROK family protein [Anaerolineae bacterium]|nr:ROK family protein [Anaerolineae bacterium]
MIGAVDIGGTKIAVGMVSEKGQLLAAREAPTEPELGPAAGLQRMVTMLHETAAQAGGELQGIGIGCTGRHQVLSGRLGDVEAFLPGWAGMPLAEQLAGQFGVSVALENDADAAALAEAGWGAGQGLARFIYVTVSTGIGGGLVFDGRLYRGVGGAHPEIGHHVIDPTGPRCFCGAHGCWESLASGSAMARRWRAEQPGLAQWDARQICEAAGRGDPAALDALDQEGYTLGVGLANLITLFAPDMIALGGGVMRSLPLLWPQVQAVIAANCGLVPHRNVRLEPASLGPEVGLVGAARCWLHRFG